MREGDTQKESQSSAVSPSEAAHVRIVGNLGRAPNGEKIDREIFNTPIGLGSLLDNLQEKYKLDLRRDSILVMINGVEARALEDLDTVLQSGDEVVLVPMFHGG